MKLNNTWKDFLQLRVEVQDITIGLQFFGIWNLFQATLSSLDILVMKSHFPFSVTARELKHCGLHWMKVKVKSAAADHEFSPQAP